MQSDEKTISALTAQAHNAEADKRTLQRKLAASERRVQDLEKRLADQQAASDDKIRELTDKLSLEMAKVSDMIQQLVSYMTGKGDVSLAGTIHETVVAGIREEVRKEMRQEYQGIIDSQAAEIAALKALQNHDNDGGESPQTTIKKLEQRNQDLNRDLHGQKTEGKYNGRNDMTPADEADLNGEDVPESTFDVSEEEFTEVMDVINSARKNAIKSNGRKKGQKVPHRFQPLKASAREIIIEPKNKPEGAKMYEIYNAAGIIMRVACAVHVRRPFWKLKEASDDAARIVYLFDEVFRKERKWNDEEGMTNEKRRRRRWEEVYPILHELKNILDRMENELNKETEPDLVRAVNFAQKEYPQLLRYLDDGKLAFSNNICELQMRQIAIYRNNSFFLGSVKSAKRFARLISLVQSAKNCKRNVQKYFHDNLNRVMVTAKEELVNCLPHKWVEPVTIPLVY